MNELPSSNIPRGMRFDNGEKNEHLCTPRFSFRISRKSNYRFRLFRKSEEIDSGFIF